MQKHNQKEHLYKLLVIGDLGVGKTSIIKRYVHQNFSPHYRATIGVDFALKVLNWDAETVVRLQLWDIAALSSNHREALLDKEGEISLLLEKLRMKEAEISRMREEEAQRASFLQNAIMAYVQGSPLGTHSSRK